jgi:LysM repeat protein
MIMSKKVSLFLLVVMMLGALLTACDRPASTAPAATATGGANFPFPLAQPTDSVAMFATQTAIAANLTPGAVVPTAQPGVNPTKAPVVNPTPGGVAPTAAQPQPTQPAQPTAKPPQPKPEIPVVTATPGRPATYTIQQGDHYICIARRYNLNLTEFFNLNGLAMSSQAVAGVTVKIPQGGSWNSDNGSRTLKAHPDTYTVQSGDTLNKIACSFGDADPNLIALANGLSAPYSVSPGQTLNIP